MPLNTKSRLNKATLAALTLSTMGLFTACSFVEVKPGAEHIILSNDSETCKRIGQTTVSVLNEFMFAERNQDVVAEELQILAQNSAAKMGGNAIWPESEVSQGERDFGVYRCGSN